MLAAAMKEQPKAFGGAWNFGPRGDSIRTVGDLAEGFVSKWGSGRVEIDKGGAHVHEARLLHLNCDKALQELGWQPRWDFLRTVHETVAWYRSVTQDIPALDVSRRQIRSYMEESCD